VKKERHTNGSLRRAPTRPRQAPACVFTRVGRVSLSRTIAPKPGMTSEQSRESHNRERNMPIHDIDENTKPTDFPSLQYQYNPMDTHRPRVSVCETEQQQLPLVNASSAIVLDFHNAVRGRPARPRCDRMLRPGAGIQLRPASSAILRAQSDCVVSGEAAAAPVQSSRSRVACGARERACAESASRRPACARVARRTAQPAIGYAYRHMWTGHTVSLAKPEPPAMSHTYTV